ncbi:MAG: HEPN domain-containing protein [Chloroflexi bacterium]|nr:MAG: HEPN domain-containing protein [Chloroflexota bacterium]TMG29657.1 MAG: HEPN domain-containing protein [Chloroflexota bacterium]
MARGKTVQVRRNGARLYLDKAIQFIEQARSGLDAGRNDAALLDAIHAAISGTDAVTTALAGVRSTDPDHQRAADLLEDIVASAPEDRQRARQLRSLLARKNAVEYESRKTSLKEARDGVERAGRIVDWAKDVLASARL